MMSCMVIGDLPTLEFLRLVCHESQCLLTGAEGPDSFSRKWMHQQDENHNRLSAHAHIAHRCWPKRSLNPARASPRGLHGVLHARRCYKAKEVKGFDEVNMTVFTGRK